MQALTCSRCILSERSRRGGCVGERHSRIHLAQSKYSISGEYNRCLLHLWSAERAVEAEVKNGTLRLAVQKLGRRHTETAASATAAWPAAQDKRLRRTLDLHSDLKIVRLMMGIDLEKSFGPVYTRGLMRQGRWRLLCCGECTGDTVHRCRAHLRTLCLPTRADSERSGGRSEDVVLEDFRTGERMALLTAMPPNGRCFRVDAMMTRGTADRGRGDSACRTDLSGS